MKTYLTRIYRFEAAHRLTGLAADHKCMRPHGHGYRLEVTVSGQVDGRGMIIDGYDLDALLAPMIANLDHQDLNKQFRQPTAENIAAWLFELIEGLLILDTYGIPPALERVRLYETERLFVEVLP